MEWLSPARYAAELATETARFAEAASASPADRVVPTCPEWTVRDLVTHVGTGHRYASLIIKTDQMQPYELIAAPQDQVSWPSWLAEGARELNATVEERGFHTQVWTWQPKHLIAGFWLRRMVHDLVVHRFDAAGDGELAPDLAADGVADLLGSFEMFDRLAGDGETLQFIAPDADRAWHVTRAKEGIEWREARAPADVALTAPARELVLILNRRLPSPPVEGDQAVWEAWREGSRF
ncbi:maleylpyruvate isomerase family mycothiol-dependent enzyme [Paractinoplanes atraurantiacus]|uniref:TIGR03083 family protein n=1 Tax=Paractinoplanes atraurantiacus TaxID=1036182 RepID=A0A285HA37_9ACTN|nr:maleylpyruvate isomerase family mycothiol-dependent enzyme [Actinoplanes atraurantiacus]SNY32588.1 TIGR03083 family protein [Actinoplanes atraurantiacus]